jgi:hypothetical protein
VNVIGSVGTHCAIDPYGMEEADRVSIAWKSDQTHHPPDRELRGIGEPEIGF